MRPTSADIITGLKFLKSAVHKSKHRACQYFHFEEKMIWTYDGEYAATMDIGLGFTGKVKTETVLKLIKDGESELNSLFQFVEPLDIEFPYPADRQLTYVMENTWGLAGYLKELFKELEFTGWQTSSILLGKHALVASNGEKTFVRALPAVFTSAEAAVLPERFARFLSRQGDPVEIRAKKVIKADYLRGPIKCSVYADGSGVCISDILSSEKKLQEFGAATHAHVIEGKLYARACSNCELSYQCKLKVNKMPGSGPTGAMMFVGKHPSMDDATPFDSNLSYGKLFWELLRDAGYAQGEVYVSNCIKCAPVSMNAGATNWKACQDNFREELERVKPKMIVAVGAEATGYLTGRTGVMGLRGSGLSCILDESYTVYPVRQPMVLEHAQRADKDALKASLISDLRDLRHIYYNGGTTHVDTIDEQVDYQIAETPEDVDRFLEELDKAEDLSCDLETTGFDEYEEGSSIVAIGFSTGPGHGRAIPLLAKGESSLFWWSDDYLNDTLIPKIKAFLLRKKVFGHNFIKFDCRWTRKHLGISPPNIDFDTLLGAYAAFHGLRSYELEVLANSLCGMKRWKREFTLENTRQLSIYLCKDVDATYRVRKEIEKIIDPAELWLLRNILIPVAHELSFMEEIGVRIDIPQIDKVDALLTQKIIDSLAALRAIPAVVGWELENGI